MTKHPELHDPELVIVLSTGKSSEGDILMMVETTRGQQLTLKIAKDLVPTLKDDLDRVLSAQ